MSAQPETKTPETGTPAPVVETQSFDSETIPAELETPRPLTVAEMEALPDDGGEPAQDYASLDVPCDEPCEWAKEGYVASQDFNADEPVAERECPECAPAAELSQAVHQVVDIIIDTTGLERLSRGISNLLDGVRVDLSADDVTYRDQLIELRARDARSIFPGRRNRAIAALVELAKEA